MAQNMHSYSKGENGGKVVTIGPKKSQSPEGQTPNVIMFDIRHLSSRGLSCSL